MENKKISKEGFIEFVIKTDGKININIQCKDFTYIQMLGLLEHAKFLLTNDNNDKL